MTFKFSKSGIVISHGDSLVLPINFYRDITNATVHFMIKDVNNGALILEKSWTDHQNAIKGETIFKLSARDTLLDAGTYNLFMDITFENGDVLTFYPATIGDTAHFHVVAK